LSGTNFDHVIACLWINHINDALDDARVM